MSSLKTKTITGLSWSFIDNFSKLGLTFVIGIILARMLRPQEFGLIGMVTIFIALSQSLVDSGFTQALIRKKDCTQADFSTVFYFNLFVGIVLYAVLFLSAGAISRFFDEPQLRLIIQVVGLGIIVNAFSIVQWARLTKEINFKLLTKISIIATICSGIIGIMMAYKGYGVWSLVFKTLLGYAITSLLLWRMNKWKPSMQFSVNSFKEMFYFGYKLLLGGLIYTSYKNIYLLIIGKYFSAIELGYFTRAEQFANLPSQNINNIIQRVTYPILSSIQDDKNKMKAIYKRLIKSTMLITFFLIFGMVAIAEPLVLTLIGEKWLPSVVYLQLLCIVKMSFPLHELNVTLLKVQGRSNLILKLEIIEKLLAIPVIILGIYFSIITLLIGMILHSIIALYINSTWSVKDINYSFLQMIKDITPSFLIGFTIGMIVFITGYIFDLQDKWKLLIQIIVWVFLFIGINEAIKVNEYLYLKSNILEQLRKIKRS